MPIYPYHCHACDHQFEKLQKISDPLLTVCPQCGEGQLQKVVTAAGFQLKGSGWYVTDFRDKKNNAADHGKSDATSEAGSDTGSNSSADNKSDMPTKVNAGGDQGSQSKKSSEVKVASTGSKSSENPAKKIKSSE